MTPEHWARVKQLLGQALELPPSEVPAFVEKECAGDAALRAELESLLASHMTAESDNEAWEQAQETQVQAPVAPTKIGPYTILERLGAGGMAEVFRVRDERLGREVALKTLKPECASDGELVARFLQEARAVSVLEHPNVARLYDIGDWNGRPYLTMELVIGETLRERLKRGPMLEQEILRAGAEVAAALDTAHAHGILHRDIKPANVMLKPDGQVKVLDFGIAKILRTGETGEVPVVSLTKSQVVAGTPSYMSPEQARGEELDVRSDLFSLGCLMFEMATGRQAFPGPRSTEQILISHPMPPSRTNPAISYDLDAIILKALEKDRNRRHPTAAALRADVLTLMTPTESGRAAVPGLPQRERLVWPWVVGAAAVAGFALFGYLNLIPVRRPPPRVTLFSTVAGRQTAPVFSPSGDRVAFTWTGPQDDNPDIYVKLVGEGPPLRLTKDPANDLYPVWSPDGRYLVFLRNSPNPAARGYYQVPALGGAERKIADANQPFVGVGGRGVDWSPDGQWLAIADTNPAKADRWFIDLFHFQTGERKRLISRISYLWNPVFSPDSKALAFTHGVSHLAHDIYLMPVAGGEPARITADSRWIAGISFLPGGNELLFSSTRAGLFALWRVSTAGKGPEPVGGVGTDAYSPNAARDGNRLVFTNRRLNVNIWRAPTAGGEEPRTLIRSTRTSGEADYSPDGTRIAYASDSSGSWEIWVADADGTNPQKITSMNGPQTGSPRWSPDGTSIIFDSRPEGNSDLFLISSHGGTPRRLMKDSTDDYLPSWSRDGKAVYFISDRSGTAQLWRMEVDGASTRQITTEGAEFALESASGDVLYYSRGNHLYSRTLPDLAAESEKLVAKGVNGRDFAVAGKYVYYVSAEQGGAQSVTRLDPATGQSTPAGSISRRTEQIGAIVVSPDGKWLVFDRTDQSDTEMMILENLQ